MKNVFKKISYWFEDRLKDIIGELTPDKRIVFTITMLVLFTALSLYFSFSSIYNFGKGKGDVLKIQHIEKLELELKKKQEEMDSMKQQNQWNDERERQ